MAMNGVFISFEGGDGSGKSTQIAILADLLAKHCDEVVVTREPGGSPGGEAIRELLVKGDKDRWSPVTEALLMYAARRDHLEKMILPALSRGAIVISDRFADSSMAYQGVAGNVGHKTLASLRNIVVGENDPDLTLILDVPASAGLARADVSEGEGRFEEKGGAFQEAVRTAFLEVAKQEPQRCAIIDAVGTIEEVSARVEAVARERLPLLFK